MHQLPGRMQAKFHQPAAGHPLPGFSAKRLDSIVRYRVYSPAMGARLYIGKVAAAAGLNVQTVRYYERMGLLAPAKRTESGYRVYSPDVLERLNFIRQAQGVGFRLEEIREILRMKYAGESPCNCVRGILQRKLNEVEKQMAALSSFRRQLRSTLQRAGTLPRLSHQASAICPLIENISSVRGKGGERR